MNTEVIKHSTQKSSSGGSGSSSYPDNLIIDPPVAGKLRRSDDLNPYCQIHCLDKSRFRSLT